MPQPDKTAGALTARRMDVLCWFLVLATTFVLCSESVGIRAGWESTIVVGMSWWLVRKTTAPFNFRRVMITSFWYLTYLGMIFLPAFFVFAVQEDPYRSRYLFAVHTVLVTVPIGWLLANWVCRFRQYENERFFSMEIADTTNRRRVKRIYLFLLVPSIVLTIIYVHSVETIPLFYLLRNPGEYLQIALLREDSFKLLDSPFLYAFALVRSVLFPILVMVSFGAYLQTRKRIWRSLFIGTLVVAVFYCSLSVAKAPVAAIVAFLGFFFYYYRRGSISKRAVALLLAFVLIFPLIVIWISYEGVESAGTSYAIESAGAFSAIGSRLFYVPSETVYYYFEVYPNHQEFLHGRSIDKLARLMGWAAFDTANYVGVYSSPTGMDSVAANAAFFANFYADFGMLGVLLGGILTGFIMQWFHIYAVRRKKTVVAIAFYSFLTYTFWFLHSTSLSIVLASDGAILALVISWWFDRRVLVPPERLSRGELQPA
jgi:oligosaccharide repeat unit polymerase